MTPPNPPPTFPPSRSLFALQGTSLFLYVSTWHVTPSLDQTLANLARLFGRENAKGRWILEVEYTIEPAYG